MTTKKKARKTKPNVVMMSLWRDDTNKRLEDRIQALLSKEGVTRWVWVVGNSQDATEDILRQTAKRYNRRDITVIRFDSDNVSEVPRDRAIRLSETANAGLDTVRDDDDVWVIHESDLVSPDDVVTRLLSHGKDSVAGMVWLGEGGKFYDVWAYRKDGVKFRAHHPYHAAYIPDGVFEVDSYGSVFSFPAQALRDGVRCKDMCVLDICAGLKKKGYTLWVDPTLDIIQPRDLFISRGHA